MSFERTVSQNKHDEQRHVRMQLLINDDFACVYDIDNDCSSTSASTTLVNIKRFKKEADQQQLSIERINE